MQYIKKIIKKNTMNKPIAIAIIIGFIIYTIIDSFMKIPENIQYIFKGIVIIGALYFLIFNENISSVIKDKLKEKKLPDSGKK